MSAKQNVVTALFTRADNITMSQTENESIINSIDG